MNTDRPWWLDAAFYHVYPLGYCDAPDENTQGQPLQPRIRALGDDLERIRDLGFNALYLGPIFESGSHGYDTNDYFALDGRLGDNDDLAGFVQRAHETGMRVVLDGVYNHVGRGFWAFRRLLEEGPGSRYRDWFRGVSFDSDNRFGDGFVYQGWEGVEELVTLNHDNPDVREHLLEAAVHSLERFGVDGIRLDVAYSLPFDFLEALGSALRARRPDFWLLGEVIHGDYAAFVAPGRLSSVTNYECYKGLWSSCNDRNLHEIAHSLNRLFGVGGMLAAPVEAGKLPYGFADNHDVSRIASTLTNPGHIFPLYALLWTMPGIPSVYYGSEYGVRGDKKDGDKGLRPARDEVVRAEENGSELAAFVGELNRVRSLSEALRVGGYRQVAVESTLLAFERFTDDAEVLVAVNIDSNPTELALGEPGRYECLFSGEQVVVDSSHPIPVPAYGARVLRGRYTGSRAV